MAETRFVETTVFGGFERTATEKRFEYLNSQVFSLKNELRECKLILAELRKGSEEAEAIQTVLTGEQAKLTQVQVQNETLSRRAKTAEEELRAREAELKNLRADMDEMAEELRLAKEKITLLESESDAVALSSVFIEAQKSAKMLIDNAHKEAADLDANSKKLAENIVADANNTAKKIIYDAEVQAAQSVAEIEDRTAQLRTAAENVKAETISDFERLGVEMESLQEILSYFREAGLDALARASESYARAEQMLKANGIPEFHALSHIEPELPDEPEYEPVDHTYFEDAEDGEEKQRTSEELERLMQMANAISGSADSETNEKPDDAGQTDNGADLAALAAKAASLVKNK